MENYIPKIWESNEVITAEKLNHIEDGISNINNVFGFVGSISLITTTEDGEHFTSVSVTSEEIQENLSTNSYTLFVNYENEQTVVYYYFNGMSDGGVAMFYTGYYSSAIHTELYIDNEGNVLSAYEEG